MSGTPNEQAGEVNMNDSTDPTEKLPPDQLSTTIRNSSRGRVAGAIALVAGVAALTAVVARWTQSRPSQPPSFPFVHYQQPAECPVHYDNAIRGSAPDEYVVKEGVPYFRRIDGRDISDLLPASPH